jgi:hypothetical protein
MNHPRRGVARANRSPVRRHLPSAVTILRRSITDQIEAVILADPTCSRASSQQVDRLLACSEAFGGQL